MNYPKHIACALLVLLAIAAYAAGNAIHPFANQRSILTLLLSGGAVLGLGLAFLIHSYLKLDLYLYARWGTARIMGLLCLAPLGSLVGYYHISHPPQAMVMLSTLCLAGTTLSLLYWVLTAKNMPA